MKWVYLRSSLKKNISVPKFRAWQIMILLELNFYTKSSPLFTWIAFRSKQALNLSTVLNDLWLSFAVSHLFPSSLWLLTSYYSNSKLKKKRWGIKTTEHWVDQCANLKLSVDQANLKSAWASAFFFTFTQ